MSDIAAPIEPALALPMELPAPSPGSEGAEPTAQSPEEKRRRRRLILLFLLIGGLLVLLGLIIWYFLFRQPLPLPVPTVINLPGYTTSLYGATNPIGVAVSPDGSRIYVAQSEGDRIVLILDSSGTEIGTAGPGTETGPEHVPVWVALDPSLVSCTYRIGRPGRSTFTTRTARTCARSHRQFPIRAGSRWASRSTPPATCTSQTWRAPPRGSSCTTAPGTSSGRSAKPTGCPSPTGSRSPDGDLFVADSNNGRLLAYRSDGTLIAQVGRGVNEGKLGLPQASRSMAATASTSATRPARASRSCSSCPATRRDSSTWASLAHTG